ncbi:MAG: nucleotidyltransferase domain-containing protein [Lachnospiraceae bacterium]|nr:nucleotidyltransferase domain-containing protein [Lachnospiraceae bacterium]
MMAVYTFLQLKDAISPIAREHGIKSVSLFGSYAKGIAKDDSDVDLLIEKGQIHSLFQLCSFRLAVEDVLRIPVDLVTTESSDEVFLNRIREEGILIYGAS